jgi:hypothetical protein
MFIVKTHNMWQPILFLTILICSVMYLQTMNKESFANVNTHGLQFKTPSDVDVSTFSVYNGKTFNWNMKNDATMTIGEGHSLLNPTRMRNSSEHTGNIYARKLHLNGTNVTTSNNGTTVNVRNCKTLQINEPNNKITLIPGNASTPSRIEYNTQLFTPDSINRIKQLAAENSVAPDFDTVHFDSMDIDDQSRLNVRGKLHSPNADTDAVSVNILNTKNMKIAVPASTNHWEMTTTLDKLTARNTVSNNKIVLDTGSRLGLYGSRGATALCMGRNQTNQPTTCITEEHIKMLRGETGFELQSSNDRGRAVGVDGSNVVSSMAGSHALLLHIHTKLKNAIRVCRYNQAFQLITPDKKLIILSCGHSRHMGCCTTRAGCSRSWYNVLLYKNTTDTTSEMHTSPGMTHFFFQNSTNPNSTDIVRHNDIVYIRFYIINQAYTYYLQTCPSSTPIRSIAINTSGHGTTKWRVRGEGLNDKDIIHNKTTVTLEELHCNSEKQWTVTRDAGIPGFNDPIVRTQNTTLQTCQEACITRPTCKSIDFAKKTAGGEKQGDCFTSDAAANKGGAPPLKYTYPGNPWDHYEYDRTLPCSESDTTALFLSTRKPTMPIDPKQGGGCYDLNHRSPQTAGAIRLSTPTATEKWHLRLI